MSDDKKPWRVRAWDATGNQAAEALALEAQLNELDAEGYDVHDLDLKEKLIVGVLKEDEEPEGVPSFFDMLRNVLKDKVHTVQIAGETSAAPSDEEDEEAVRLEGSYTAVLLNAVIFGSDDIVVTVRDLPSAETTILPVPMTLPVFLTVMSSVLASTFV